MMRIGTSKKNKEISEMLSKQRTEEVTGVMKLHGIVQYKGNKVWTMKLKQNPDMGFVSHIHND